MVNTRARSYEENEKGERKMDGGQSGISKNAAAKKKSHSASKKGKDDPNFKFLFNYLRR